MTAIDLAFGLLAGVLSFLTPESILLLPLLLCAIGARERPVTLAIGLGLSLVITGALADSIGTRLGYDAVWLRRLACVLLLLEGIALNIGAVTDRLGAFTGGTGESFDHLGPSSAGIVSRQLLLALFVGANWVPRLVPALGKTVLMAADGRTILLALGALFVFGVGAALPWIVLGRMIRLFPGMAGAGLTQGMAGKRLLGLTLIAVAVLGLTGLDVPLVHAIDAFSPAWATKLAATF